MEENKIIWLTSLIGNYDYIKLNLQFSPSVLQTISSSMNVEKIHAILGMDCHWFPALSPAYGLARVIEQAASGTGCH
ncbi:hypothetical protein GV64_19720 [Endozoicomonas elysicola]|uniref:Uncharacterized protein n=1 Tax=Endozoicomonas elysicola TaxID=305900 RepID=A0A081KET5_9GAMM|nr:hypothetical protein GV64_19720 [Endozoicomonas elysicola]